ncbi:MAG: hypothetical protein LBR10_04855 [Prevotellaceae bacterium]|jgi:hypothetical protein|nr:hypothetical protein [Prevotellaceae bacterium]
MANRKEKAAKSYFEALLLWLRWKQQLLKIRFSRLQKDKGTSKNLIF